MGDGRAGMYTITHVVTGQNVLASNRSVLPPLAR